MITLRISWNGFALAYHTGRFHNKVAGQKHGTSVSLGQALLGVSVKTNPGLDVSIGGSS